MDMTEPMNIFIQNRKTKYIIKSAKDKFSVF